jgi:Chemotaxis protein histidine kinase and related kinases
MLPDTVILSTIEIETLLSDIRGRLILHVRNDSKPDNADELFEWTLRFFGLMDLEDRSDLRQQAGDLAESIYALKDTTPTDHGKLISKSLDILSEIEATIVSSRSDDEPFDVDITSLLDASLIGSTPSSPEESLAAEDSFEGFEIDAELLEIFSEEADELLKSIEESLARLTSNPEDTDALWEIRRNAHTFKGASGVVGLNAASKISHRIEDLLDRFAEKEAGSGLPILELLQTAASCLRSMTTVDGLHPDADQLDRLNKSFDVALSRIEKVADEPAPIVQPEVIANPQSSVAKIDAEESSASGDRKRSIIRVPLEKLNELEAALHDLVVGSSAIERRLTDLDHQILELNNTTHRLKTTSGKIESGFEAEMLGKLSAFDVGLSTPVDDNDFDPLEFDRYTEFHENTRVLAETASDTLAVNTSLDAIRSGLETLSNGRKIAFGRSRMLFSRSGWSSSERYEQGFREPPE